MLKQPKLEIHIINAKQTKIKNVITNKPTKEINTNHKKLNPSENKKI